MQTKIVYEDKFLIVVYKPAGLATQTNKIGQSDVESEIKNYLGSPYLGLVHRLDQPVEGLLVLGKTEKASAGLAKQLTENTLKKRYLAMVCGEIKEQQTELVDHLYKTKENRAEILSVEELSDAEIQRLIREKGVRKACLRYRVEKKAEQTDTSAPVWRLDVEIDTGRFHQIRAQLSHAGLPILGDLKYGTELSKQVSRELGVRGVALCADRLQFRHPETKEVMSFEITPENPAFTRN
ncbi:MAG: RluA family pseudouridine synthase [Lachnospiraceae bacterium]|nr:RluA family pseudouridine synthase [Lachnospiraceae bacterium]MBR1852006.1 RluA family pseudouridine synthase [Lachnospiraceae bacterium]